VCLISDIYWCHKEYYIFTSAKKDLQIADMYYYVFTSAEEDVIVDSDVFLPVQRRMS
jgi:hypothetical protein